MDDEVQYLESKFGEDDGIMVGKTVLESEGIKELKSKVQFPEEIISKAIEIYHEIERNDEFNRQKALKKDKRNRRVFVCIYMAYNRLNNPVDPKYLIQRLGVSCNIDKSINENNITLVVDPVRLSEFYLKRLGEVANVVVDVQQMLREIKELLDDCRVSKIGQDYIDNTPVKVISIGAICYILTYNYDVFEQIKNRLSKAWYISPSCIRKYRDKISEIYNDRGHQATYNLWF